MARRNDQGFSGAGGEESTGAVLRLIREKGFGFIKDDGGAEFFFHRSAVADFDSLTEGARVTYVQGSGPKGPRAEHVRIV